MSTTSSSIASTTVKPYDPPLILTTPHIKGKKVMDAQWLLSGHNRFQNGDNGPILRTLTGRIDGEYGPVTASATKEAKFELGYPLANVNNNFGQMLYELLVGTRDLTGAYQTTRKMRANKPLKVKCLESAITHLGTKEQPYGSNRQKYGEWYGMNGVPWCAIFCSYIISGIMAPALWKHSYVPEIVNCAQHGRDYLSITFDPEPGDLIAYTFNGRVDCHIEFFEKWNPGRNSFSAVGGNTGPSNFSNGGEVARSTRYDYQVSHFMRLTLPPLKELT